MSERTRPRERGDRPPRDVRTARATPRRPVTAPDRARGRRRLRVALAVVACVVLVVGGGLGVTLGSPWLDVARVEVVGAAPENRPAVEQAAAVAPATSLVWLDGDLTGAAVAERVRELPRIASVDVARRWPDTLVVTVSEREPVLAVGHPDGVALVDGSGFAYRTIDVAPEGVPMLVLPFGVAPAPQEPSTVAAVGVVGALPDDLRAAVTEIRANGAFDVTFTMERPDDDPAAVRWGAAVDDERKAAVLRALLSRPGTTYDVSTPELALVR